MAGGADLAVKTFPCNQCGLCCRNVHLAKETRSLDRGDGTCSHYNDIQKLCTIYAHRPDICRVDRQYELNYAKQYSWEEFVDLNIQVCHALAEQAEE